MTVVADWVKLPQRPAGDTNARLGATESTQTSSGRLVPVSALLVAEVTETCSSVAAVSLPVASSVLSGSVTPVKCATKPSPLGQLSPAVAAVVRIPLPSWTRLVSPLWPTNSVAVPAVSVQATTSA